MSILRSLFKVMIDKTASNVNIIRNYHALSRVQTSILPDSMLNPTSVSIMPACGFKVKGHLKKRCKDCYFVRRQERLYVICEKHPRHKQMSMVKDEKNTWILTHATQGKIRPW